MDSQSKMEEGGESSGESMPAISFLSGTCPDPKCQTRLYWLSNYQSIECTGCGQMHPRSVLQNVKEEKGDMYHTALFALKSLIAGCKPEPGTDNVKVHGLSNYLCKLLSHLMSRYGMDKVSGCAKLLTDMGQPEIFNCGVLCDRAFMIDSEHLNIAGYGRDKSGSLLYLQDTLNVARENNDTEEHLVPIHADGDGHCLVHAVSRALVGRELFWHPLRLNLMSNLRDNLDRYKLLLENFVDVDEWETIINECKPSFVPTEGEAEGLRNIHIFGLANVLKRPIILLDNLSGMSSSGDYSGVFLPALLEPDQCKNKEGTLNPPLCIAWSSQGRNHFIPLVGIKGKPCPRLPRYMLQSAWGVHPSLLDKYIQFDEQGCCIIGGPKALHENYIQRLVSAMEKVFYSTYNVHPALVADVHQYIFRSKGFVGATPEMVTDTTQSLIHNRALLRCLRCESLTALMIEEKMLVKGGQLYELAIKEIGQLSNSKLYTFRDYQISCRYDSEKDVLIPDISQVSCSVCTSKRFRYMRGDGTVEYHDGDVTLEPSGPNAKCSCGFKHYYNGKFYDNRPRELPVPLEWGPKKQMDIVQWWDNESDPELNSNAYQIAQDLVLKHFPGEFGIERLQQKIVSAILLLTATEDKDSDTRCQPASLPEWNPEEASKIILSGFQRQGIHKEELTKSESEREVKKRIVANAPDQQAKKSALPSKSGPKRASLGSSPVRASTGRTHVASGSSSPAPATPPSTPKSAAHGDSGVSAPTTTPNATPTHSVGTREKKIRIEAPGGRSETVTLTEEVTFSQLQQLVFNAIQIPPQNQKLRLGFPPKVLSAPAPGDTDAVVPLNHGDKISVESTASETQRQSSPAHSSPFHHVLGGVNARMPSDDALLNALAARPSGADSLDTALISVGLLADRMGLDLWAMVQTQPHHFSCDGLYYRQAHRDVGLVHDKHFQFPAFPGKTFVYNAAMDRLELCLDSLGHFPVEPDVETKAKNSDQKMEHHLPQHHHPPGNVLEVRHDSHSRATFGSSGAITKGHSTQGVFEGQGHSLRDSTEAKMPQDVTLAENIQSAARRLQNFCDPDNSQSMKEELEGMEVDEVKAAAEGDGVEGREEGYSLPKYTRKGPGYSVLEPTPPSAQTTDPVQQQHQDAVAPPSKMDSSGGGEGHTTNNIDSSAEGEEKVVENMDSSNVKEKQELGNMDSSTVGEEQNVNSVDSSAEREVQAVEDVVSPAKMEEKVAECNDAMDSQPAVKSAAAGSVKQDTVDGESMDVS